jgi:hypothetical protein
MDDHDPTRILLVFIYKTTKKKTCIAIAPIFLFFIRLTSGIIMRSHVPSLVADSVVSKAEAAP